MEASTQLTGDRAEFFWRSVADEWTPATNPGELSDQYDFVIVGGGVTGLWAAWHILDREPNASVALLEAEHIAFGASGRNAGYLVTRVGPTNRELALMGDLDQAGALARAGEDNLATVVKRIAELGIECDLVETDEVTVSTHPSFDGRVEKDIVAAEKLGVKVQPLDRDEVQSRITSPILTRGFAVPGALVNPVKLMHGLASALERKGLAIFERSLVKEVRQEGDGCAIVMGERTLRARHVFMARHAWDSLDRSQVMPMYTYQCVTAPLTDQQWDDIGWKGGEAYLDARWLYHNWRPTADGRIVFGGGTHMSFGARIAPRFDASKRALRKNRTAFEALFPQLRSVPFEMTWGGPLAMTPDQIAKVGLLHGGRAAYSHGYNGHGVAQAFMTTAAALDLMFGEETDRTKLLITQNLDLRYPPEPLRWLGGVATTASLEHTDHAIQQGAKGERPPHLLHLANKILDKMRVPWSR